MFESIIVSLNGFDITEKVPNYAYVDYMQTLLTSEEDNLTGYKLEDQGYYFETPGQFDVTTVDNAGVSTNKKTENFYRLFASGAKVKMSFKPKISILKPNTLFNMSNKIQIVLRRNAEKFYLICSSTDQAKIDDAKKYSIRLFNMKCRYMKYDLNDKIAEQYINSYTDTNPDRYQFLHHHILNYSINPNSMLIEQTITTDSMPNLIAVTFLNQLGQLGSINTNPFKFMPVPAAGDGLEFELQFTANGQTFRYDPVKDNHEAWRRYDQLLGKNFRRPLMSKHLITANDQSYYKDHPARSTGYAMYFESLNLSAVGADGCLYEDKRGGCLVLKVKLAGPNRFDKDLDIMVHLFSYRNIEIRMDGSIGKDYN